MGADGRPDLIAWSAGRVALFRNGRTLVANTGLEDLRGVQFIAPGDFDNDGLPDLCVLTAKGATLYRNTGTRFVKQADLATGNFRKAVWIDYDHDYDEDLILIGDDSRLMRNNGEAGFSDETKRFPFVAGRALDAVPFDLEPDTPGFDLVVSYADRPGVLYRDRLGGTYQAVPLPELPPGARELVAADFESRRLYRSGFRTRRPTAEPRGRTRSRSADGGSRDPRQFGRRRFQRHRAAGLGCRSRATAPWC